MDTMKFLTLFCIFGITMISAMKLSTDMNLAGIYEAAEKELEAQLQLRSTNRYKWTSHTWKTDGPSEMSKRNKIFQTIHNHLKNEFDLDDATARTFAKRALFEFRSSGSEAVTRTSVLCNNETAVNCDSTSRFRTIEGTCNNLEKPHLGAFAAQFIREIAVEPYDALSIIISDPDIVSGCHDEFNGNGGSSCCTSSNQCGAGEGDCDNDSQCFGSLMCGTNNCDSSLGFPANRDCCYDPNIPGTGCQDEFNGNGGSSCCTRFNTCSEGEGDCDSDSDCFGDLQCGVDNCDPSLGFPSNRDCCFDPNEPPIPGTGCQNEFNGNGGSSCCTGFNLCSEGEGDCDNDSQCFGDLKCGENNCDPSLGFPANRDCCYDPNASPSPGTGCQDEFNGNGGSSCCTGFNLCSEGEGDCDSDSQCFGDLKCGENNCDPSLGFPGNRDCCYDPNKPATPGTGCQDELNGNGGSSCCTGFNLCSEGEGDCDNDSQCFGNLKCGVNNCDSSLGFPANRDCCFDPNKVALRQSNNNNFNGCEWRDTLPSARTISHIFHTDIDLPSPDVTHMVTQWGQFLDHDITGTPEFHDPTDCCNDPDPTNNCINIPVNTTLDGFYSQFGVECLGLHRSEPFCAENEESGKTREHFNINTHFIDASNVYGHDEDRAESLRDSEDGLLLVNTDVTTSGLLPNIADDGSELAGDFRAREMPGLLSMHTLFVREHNRIARLIKAKQPNWDNDEIYLNARRINIAAYQSIVYGEYLPIVLGEKNLNGLELKPEGSNYDKNVDPTMTTEFATAAYRFGHSMIQGLVERFNIDNSGLFDTYFLHDVFFTSDNLKSDNGLGFEQILMGLVTQAAQTMDKEVTAETTNLLFAEGADFGGDLIARNIQRGRDHGIPGFCCYYQLYVDSNFNCDDGWENRYKDISQPNWNLLRTIYDKPSDIDIFTGGLAQGPFNGGLTGQVFQQLKYTQFLRSKNGDRFFFTHKNQAGSFTSQGREILITRTLAGVICDNTDITAVPENAFALTDRNKFISCDDTPRLDLAEIIVLLWTENP